MDKTFPPIWFQVEKRTDCNYYCGQLMLNSFKGWWLPDSEFEEYADHFGQLVEFWYKTD